MGYTDGSFAYRATEIRVSWETRRPIGPVNEDNDFEAKCHIPAIVAVIWARGSRDVLRMGLKNHVLLVWDSLVALVRSVADTRKMANSKNQSVVIGIK